MVQKRSSLCLEKSGWVPVAVLGVLKAGAAFVLLDTSQPVGRLQQICENVQAPLVVCSKRTSAIAATMGVPTMEINSHLLEDSDACHMPTDVVTPNNAAYIIFTSGSTGTPKGVVIEHRSLVASMEAQRISLHIDNTARVLQFASHAFDASILEIFGALTAGGCVCIPSEDERKENIPGAVTRMRVTWALLTPTVARILKPGQLLPSLQTLVLGGEGPSKSDIKEWCGHVRLIQAYGPAECAIVCVVTERLSSSSNPKSIGHPRACSAWIVNATDHEKLVPVGAVGELLIEGPIVARGYNNVSKTTGFVEAPSWLQAVREGRADKIYKTGDLVRYAADGSLIFVGRNDTQVKIRGQRIELGEVEYQIKEAFNNVQQVITEVICPPTDTQAAFLAAFISQDDHDAEMKNGIEGAPDFLRAPSEQFKSDVMEAEHRLHSYLPSFMVPSVFLPLAYIPRTGTDKADRKALRGCIASMTRAHIDAYRPSQAQKEMPSNQTETKLQNLTADILGIDAQEIGIHDNLFRLGLDSVGAMKLVSAARREGLTLSVADIFQQQKLSGIGPAAKEIVQVKPPNQQVHSYQLSEMKGKITAAWGLPGDQVIDILPTTLLQRHYLNDQTNHYFVIELSGLLDTSALTTAIEAIVQRHSILRTVFVPFQDTVIQVVLRDVDCSLKQFTVGEGDLLSFTESICRQDSRGQVPHGSSYFRPTLITGHGVRQNLILKLNHAQHDGLSIPQLIRDLSLAYDGKSLPSTLGFSDYVRAKIGNNSPQLFCRWRELLQGSSMTYLGPDPSDQPEPVMLTASLKDILLPTVPEGITMATVTKAAWALTLARVTGRKDVVFGQVTHGRNVPLEGIEDILGPCVNNVPVRASLDPNSVVQDLLDRIQDQHLRTIDIDTVDLTDLVEHCTSWPRETEFGSVIQYLNIPSTPSHAFAKGVECNTRLYQFRLQNPYPYVLVTPNADNKAFSVEMYVSSGTLNQERADKIVRQFREMMRVMSDAHRRVGDIIG